MTLTEKRLILAQACPGVFELKPSCQSHPPIICWRDTGDPVGEREWLSALHEVEKTLNENQQAYFVGFLTQIVPDDLKNIHRRSYTQAKFKYIHAGEDYRLDAAIKLLCPEKWKE